MAAQRQMMSMPIPAADRTTIVTDFLTSKGLPPTQAWLNDFMVPGRDSIPLSSLQQTALFRLLATDLTISLHKPSAGKFPTDISDSHTAEKRLPASVVVQLLDIEDIGSSAWSQIEAIEAQARGETTRGREIIRNVPEEPGDAAAAPMLRSSGPYKLLVQDIAGTEVYAFCMRPIERLDLDSTIGMKLVLHNILVARGTILLEPANVTVLGGRIDTWDRTWRATRKQRLQQKVSQTDIS